LRAQEHGGPRRRWRHRAAAAVAETASLRMGAGHLVWLVTKQLGIWAAAVVGAWNTDAASLGGPLGATTTFLVVGLILVVLLYVKLFMELFKDKRLEEEWRKNAEDRQKNAEDRQKNAEDRQKNAEDRQKNAEDRKEAKEFQRRTIALLERLAEKERAG